MREYGIPALKQARAEREAVGQGFGERCLAQRDGTVMCALAQVPSVNRAAKQVVKQREPY
jgi:hypothetical protein